MRIITLAKATPGLVLAKAVFTKDGRILLPVGDVLSNDNINQIKAHGISALFVQDGLDGGNAPVAAEQANASPQAINSGTGAANPSNQSPTASTSVPTAVSDPVGTVAHVRSATTEGEQVVSPVVITPKLAQPNSKSSITPESGVSGAEHVGSVLSAAGGIPQDIMNAAAEAVELRFALTQRDHELCQMVFDLAVERQAKVFLSNPQLISSNNNSAPPAFQTKKPDPVPLKSLLGTSSKLGTLPLVFHKLIEIVNDPNASAADTAEVLSADPALCAKLLKLVNSPYYGLATRIDTIPRAVTLVGTGQIVMLAMGSTLMTAFKGVPVSLINMQTFWNHSLACGLASSLLAQKFGVGQPDSYFVAGLLHDIGKLLIYSQLPGHAMYMMLTARREQVSVHSLEKETLGFYHEDLSAALLEEWRCPAALVDTIKKHHRPLTDNVTLASVTLPVGNFLAQALGYGSSGDVYLPQTTRRVWETLPISADDLGAICVALDSKIRGLRSIFSGHSR